MNNLAEDLVNKVKNSALKIFPKLDWEVFLYEKSVTAKASSDNKEFNILVRGVKPKDENSISWMAEIRTEKYILARSPNLVDIELEDALKSIHEQWIRYSEEVRSLIQK